MIRARGSLLVYAFYLINISLEITCGSIVRLAPSVSQSSHINYFGGLNILASYVYVPPQSKSERITNVDTMEEDVDYPYEQLLAIVKQTKELLSSPNVTAKEQILNFDPSYYETYLNGDNSDSVIHSITANTDTPNFLPGSALPDYGPAYGIPQSSVPQYLPPPDRYVCGKEVQYKLPKVLKNVDGKLHYILNVDEDFRQQVRTVRCSNPGQFCDNPTRWPINYMYTCEHGFQKIMKFFSIPVQKKLSISEQIISDFPITVSCDCIRKRIE